VRHLSPPPSFSPFLPLPSPHQLSPPPPCQGLLGGHGKVLFLGAIVLVIVYSLFDGGMGSLGDDLWAGGGGSSGGGSGGGGSGAPAGVRGAAALGAAAGGSGGAPAAACAGAVAPAAGHVNRPVSVEWFGRATEVIRYSPKLDDFPAGVFTTVYKHDFPGSTLWLDFWNRVNNGKWEHETLWVLEFYLSPKRHPGAVYVDFGSWIGPTILFAGQFASKVYSLEPDPLSFSTLNANVHQNPVVAAKTQMYHECIAPKAGVVEMAGSGESNTRISGLLDTKFLKAGTHWKVNCRTLDQFIREEGVDMANLRLIKMDTEGTELWLLPTLRPWLESLGKGKKPAIWLSVHSPFWKDQDKPEHLPKVKAAWDVLSLFDYVYDQDLKLIKPAEMEPNLCPDFCTFLLSDIRACRRSPLAFLFFPSLAPPSPLTPPTPNHLHAAQPTWARTM
jgi:FkbM family methyltransferase